MAKSSTEQGTSRPPSPPHNIAAWPAHWARQRPGALAVGDESRGLDWGAFEARIAALAGRLRVAGVGVGDRVAVLLTNRTAFLEILFGTTRVGAIFLPINLRLSAREIAFQLDDSQPDAFFYESELQETVEKTIRHALHSPTHLWPVGGEPDSYEEGLNLAQGLSECIDVSPEHPAILMYTSGTTGAPKGALLPHRKSLYNSLNAAEYFANSKDDRVLVVAPLFHSLGLQILAVPMVHAGGALLLHRQFDPERVWEAVDRERITYLGGVPSMYQRLEDVLAESSPGRWQHPDLRFAFTAGSAASVELIRSFEARGIQLQQGYGQTETSILTCLSAAEALDRAGSVGRPVSHGEVRVVERKPYPRDPQRWRDTNPGEVGEIVVRGAITMLGYWEQPEASAQVLIQDWLCTGDLATRDSDGYLTLVGRKGDMFISGGENVYPAEVEAVYREHPAIREIAILGVPHLEWGEVGRAHLVLEPGEELDEAALHSWARERLAPFKLPRDYVLEEELPRTASGKIRKQLLTGRP